MKNFLIIEYSSLFDNLFIMYLIKINQIKLLYILIKI
jgi:hypothetical protein